MEGVGRNGFKSDGQDVSVQVALFPCPFVDSLAEFGVIIYRYNLGIFIYKKFGDFFF